MFGILIAFLQVISLYTYSTHVANIANDQSLSTDEVATEVNELSFLYSMSALTTLLTPLWKAGGAGGASLDIFVTGIVATVLMMES